TSATAAWWATGMSRLRSARTTSGVCARTVATDWWKYRYAPPAAPTPMQRAASRTNSRTRPKIPSADRPGCGGCWTRVTVEAAAGGRTTLPLPLSPAPRPTPRFSVVRINGGGACQAPAAGQDSRALGQARLQPDLGLGERDAPALGVVGELVAPDPP